MVDLYLFCYTISDLLTRTMFKMVVISMMQSLFVQSNHQPIPLSLPYRYFFLCFLALIMMGLFNGLVLFPVLLSMVGPPGEIQPSDKDAISIDPPEPTQPSPKCITKPKKRHKKRRVPETNMLSTIAEESSQCSISSCEEEEVKVKPEVKVEATVIPTSSSSNSSSGHRRRSRRVSIFIFMTLE